MAGTFKSAALAQPPIGQGRRAVALRPVGAILFDPARCYGAPITIRLVGMPLAWHQAETIGAGTL